MPDNIINMGHITGAFGILGWVKIKTEADMSNYKELLLSINGKWIPHKVEKCSNNELGANVKFASISDRDDAMALKGTLVGLARDKFPKLPDDEYYQADLVGLTVTNLQNENLGTVKNIMDTGANIVLVVKDDKLERLIPFVGVYITSVSIEKKQIIVDWGLDY
jgi:16S rRNA processing protein RimM